MHAILGTKRKWFTVLDFAIKTQSSKLEMSHLLPMWLQLSKMLQTWQVFSRLENPSRNCRFVSANVRLQPLKGRLRVTVEAAGTPAASSSSDSESTMPISLDSLFIGRECVSSDASSSSSSNSWAESSGRDYYCLGPVAVQVVWWGVRVIFGIISLALFAAHVAKTERGTSV